MNYEQQKERYILVKSEDRIHPFYKIDISKFTETTCLSTNYGLFSSNYYSINDLIRKIAMTWKPDIRITIDFNLNEQLNCINNYTDFIHIYYDLIKYEVRGCIKIDFKYIDEIPNKYDHHHIQFDDANQMKQFDIINNPSNLSQLFNKISQTITNFNINDYDFAYIYFYNTNSIKIMFYGYILNLKLKSSGDNLTDVIMIDTLNHPCNTHINITGFNKLSKISIKNNIENKIKIKNISNNKKLSQIKIRNHHNNKYNINQKIYVNSNKKQTVKILHKQNTKILYTKNIMKEYNMINYKNYNQKHNLVNLIHLCYNLNILRYGIQYHNKYGIQYHINYGIGYELTLIMLHYYIKLI